MNPSHKQSLGDGRCAALVAALATKTPVEAFEAFVQSKFGVFRGPYLGLHVYSYLLNCGYLCGMGLSKPQPEAGAVSIRYELKSHPAYVVVRGSGCDHAVYWDGSRIWDPDPHTADGKPLSFYQIETWVPIYRLD